jgi:hypothetical protein
MAQTTLIENITLIDHTILIVPKASFSSSSSVGYLGAHTRENDDLDDGSNYDARTIIPTHTRRLTTDNTT